MGLASVVGNALDGLQTTQSAIGIVARNVANAGTEGYTRKVHNQTTSVLGDGSTVVAEAATRQLDITLQRQLRAERASSGYADTMAELHSRIDALFGQPGGENALDTRVADFAASLQALTTSPDDLNARAIALGEATALAGHLNGLSGDVQTLREQAETGIGDSVAGANGYLEQIAALNTQIVSQKAAGTLNVDTLDKRDGAIDKLSRLLDIRVIESANGLTSVYTDTGHLLVDVQPNRLEFDARATLGAGALYSTDPDERGVGTVTLVSAGGGRTDLIRDKAIRSGEIAAYLEVRDGVLVQAQAQLDELASGLALALSTSERAGTTSGTGFALSVSDLQRGDLVTLTLGTQRLSLVNASDPAALPAGAAPEPRDLLSGIDFSQADAALQTSVQAALDALLGPGRALAGVAAGVLTITDGTADVTGLTARVSAPSAEGGAALPLFKDGPDALYTNAFEGEPQKTGFAARITVSREVAGDPSRLVLFDIDASDGFVTPAADPSRPRYLYERLTEASFAFSPATGIGTSTTPKRGSVAEFALAVVSDRAIKAQAAQSIAEGQEIVVSGLEQRYESVSAVSIDDELATLLELQTAYSANARVMQIAQELVDMMLQLGR